MKVKKLLTQKQSDAVLDEMIRITPKTFGEIILKRNTALLWAAMNGVGYKGNHGCPHCDHYCEHCDWTASVHKILPKFDKEYACLNVSFNGVIYFDVDNWVEYGSCYESVDTTYHCTKKEKNDVIKFLQGHIDWAKKITKKRGHK